MVSGRRSARSGGAGLGAAAAASLPCTPRSHVCARASDEYTSDLFTQSNCTMNTGRH